MLQNENNRQPHSCLNTFIIVTYLGLTLIHMGQSFLTGEHYCYQYTAMNLNCHCSLENLLDYILEHMEFRNGLKLGVAGRIINIQKL